MPEIRFFVDEKVPHGVVAKVMAMASRVGLSKLVFVNQPEAQ
jgi:biopolymer transport protein ExbD